MVKSNARILLVENDAELAAQITAQLEQNAIEAVTVKNGTAAIEYLGKIAPQVIVSEMELADIEGLRLCRTIKSLTCAPLIFLSEKSDTFNTVLALEMGADDCITKPFDVRELAARVKVGIRHMRFYMANELKTEEANKPVVLPGLLIDAAKFTVELDGKTVNMPPKELNVLHLLAQQPNTVFTRDQLLERIWGYDFFGNSRTVDVHVKRIREKLNNGNVHPWKIETVWGAGYKFTVSEENRKG